MTWETVPLGDITELHYGRALKAEDRSGSRFPVIGSGGVVGYHDTALVTDPTIVVGRKGSIGSLTYAPHGCWPIDTAYFVRPTRELDLRWLYWAIGALGLDGMNRSAAVPGLNREDAYRATVSLPPLAEQRRIALVLDTANAVKAARSRTLDLVESLRLELAQAHLQHLSGAPVRIGDFTTVRSGSTPSRTDAENFGGDTPWLKTGEVRRRIHRTEEHVTDIGIRAARLRVFPAGSVVVAMYGQGSTRGKSGVLEVAATVNQACAVILANDRFDSTVLQVQLELGYRKLRTTAEGGTQPNLSLSRVADFRVILPDRAARGAISRDLVTVEAQQRLAEQQLTESDLLLAALQDRAFRGEL